MTTFQAAAVSYFGLPEGTVLIPSDPGHIAFHVVLDAPTVAGIADRMNEMAKAEQDEVPLAVRPIDLDVLRAEYDAMGERGRGQYGSFARYARQRAFDLLHADNPIPMPRSSRNTEAPK